jgi:hypothetical protein
VEDRHYLAGSARLVLAAGVRHLDPASAVFEGMLGGWALQQQTRFLKPGTITSRLRLVRRVVEFCNEYPWRWEADDIEAFIVGCREPTSPIVVTTARLYETTLRMFLQYVTDPRYGWPAECVERFGVAPRQLLHEWNTIVHVGDYEGDPRRRPLTYDEVQALFDAADGIAEEVRGRGRKGSLRAMRDAALLKTMRTDCAGAKPGGWIWLTCAIIRRFRRLVDTAACSCDGANRHGAALLNVALC